MDLVKDYPQNVLGQDYVVGDLHGCYQTLMNQLFHLGFDFKYDRLFCVGDLVDRGPDSVKCLGLLERPWFHCVLGNHEQILMAYADDPSDDTKEWWVANGGGWCTHAEAVDYAAKLENLPMVIDIHCGNNDRVLISHAQFPFSSRKEAEEAFKLNPDGVAGALTWQHLDDKTLTPTVHGYNAVFHGHTIVAKMGNINNHYYIDTGAFLGTKDYPGREGKLTVVKISKAKVDDRGAILPQRA